MSCLLQILLQPTLGYICLFKLWFFSGYMPSSGMCVSARSCPTLCSPMDCSPPDSSAHGIFQARILEWGFITLGDLPDPGIEATSLASPALAGGFFTTSATWEAQRWDGEININIYILFIYFLFYNLLFIYLFIYLLFIYNYGLFMLLYGRNQHNIVK